MPKVDSFVEAFDSGWPVCVCAGLVKAPLKRSRSTADGGDEDGPEQLQELLECGAVDEEQKTDNTTLLRLLEEGEKVKKFSLLFFLQIWFSFLFLSLVIVLFGCSVF